MDLALFGNEGILDAIGTGTGIFFSSNKSETGVPISDKSGAKRGASDLGDSDEDW